MKIIIPMAGRGSRLRPHTLTTPKPLIPIAGKPMVQRLVEDLSQSLPDKVEEIAFIIGDFGHETEEKLKKVAESMNARCSIYYQDKPLGPGHAIYCARESLDGKCIVAFSDTLFKADFTFDSEEEGIIWVQKVDNPASFGVIKVNNQNIITDFVEKSPVFVSDLAIVGLYYFKDGSALRRELENILDNEIKDKGEYQLTTALEHLKEKGVKFRPAKIEEWLDCGNKANVLDTNKRMLELKQKKEKLVAPSARFENAIVIPPCFIGENALISNSVVGPHVSIGDNSEIRNSVIRNSIIQNDNKVRNANLNNSMIGNFVDYRGESSEISLGDYSEI